MTKEYDLVVLGGGIGGYVASIRAAQLGMNVAVVEANKLGGTCLHVGCIPTKSLLKTAELYRQLTNIDKYGIDVTVNGMNFNDVQTIKNDTINQLYEGVIALLKKNNVDVFHGHGRILGPSIFSPLPGTISIEYETGEENTMIVPKFVLIATGSKTKLLPTMQRDGQYILTSDDALQLTSLPKSIAIIGGGVIGIEWASLLNDLGVDVTIIESAKNILLNEDDDIRKELIRQFKKRNIKILTDMQIKAHSIDTENEQITITLSHDEELITTEKILLAVGREPNTADIGLQNTNISEEDGFIKVNDMYQTKESHIYAVGDCIKGLQLAHVASAEGIIAVEHMANLHPEPLLNENIPTAIYSYPEIAKIGLTEREARTKYSSIKIGKFPFQAIGKAHIHGETEGFAKIITDEESEDILGVHLIGKHATELISEASLAKVLNASAWEIAKTIHPHPSLAEIFPETALATENLQIHG